MWRRREPLAPHTTFRVGGPADWFVSPRDEEECATAWIAAQRMGALVWTLGGGSNLLVDDGGVRGVVISMRKMKPSRIERRNGCVSVSAGVPLAGLVSWAAREGMAGLEFLAGVPGLVGGAARMNAGGAEACFGELVEAVHTLDSEGRPATRTKRDLVWAYRASSLRDPVILGVDVKLKAESPSRVQARTREALERKRSSQPLGARSAGCVFRNPRGAAAGALIDRAGLKGASVGGAQISSVHANFIVNTGHATAEQIRGLIRQAQERVRQESGKSLELEVHIWPNPDQREK